MGNCDSKKLMLLLLALAPMGWAGEANNQPINIEADHFEMLLAEHKAMYRGNVVAVQGDYEIQADQLNILFNEDNEVVSMRADGGPAVLFDKTQEPLIAVTGARLDYHLDDATVSVTGGSTLTQGQDVVTAESIVYDLDSERALASGSEDRRVQLTLEPKNGTGARPSN